MQESCSVNVCCVCLLVHVAIPVQQPVEILYGCWAGVKVPVQRATAPRPLDNGAGPKDSEMADAAPHASVFTRVSKPADGLGAKAPAFGLANGNTGALGNGHVNSAGVDQVPNQVLSCLLFTSP